MSNSSYPNRYVLAVLGVDRVAICNSLCSIIPKDSERYSDSFMDSFCVGSSAQGLRDLYCHEQGISLITHGMIVSSDYGVMTRDAEGVALPRVIRDFRSDLRLLPNAFSNGSYMAVCSDTENYVGYAYTCFLNSIPVYYCVIKSCLVVSTNMIALRRLAGAKVEGLDHGLHEYYMLGTILSEDTGIASIKTIPKGAWLKYGNGRVEIGYYYTMPSEQATLSFQENVDQFADLWSNTLRDIQKTNLRYGLGLTGGVDSRLILAGFRDKHTPLFFTGSHADHPDWLLANHITQRLGISNHVLEDYSQSDKLRGYASYCSRADNHLHLNHMYYMDKLRFRVQHNLAFELIGLTELLGGVYHYRDRRSFLDTLRMSGPIRRHQIGRDFESTAGLITLGLRNQVLSNDLGKDQACRNDFSDTMNRIVQLLTPQIGEVRDEESFLERFRHIHKMANLLTWSHLPNRRYLECFSPSMNVELTSFACQIPLEQRDNRKLLFAYLKRYHPEVAMFPLSGYIFTPSDPWILFKLLGPQIKVLNHLGFKVPLKQWYLRKSTFLDIDSMPEVYEFQKRICRSSPIIRDTGLVKVLEKYPLDKVRLSRCYNIALFELADSLDDDRMSDYLTDIMEQVIAGREE